MTKLYKYLHWTIKQHFMMVYLYVWYSIYTCKITTLEPRQTIDKQLVEVYLIYYETSNMYKYIYVYVCMYVYTVYILPRLLLRTPFYFESTCMENK